MDICNDPDNVEMNTGASDENDEGVKDSVDEQNSDVCQKVSTNKKMKSLKHQRN